MVGILLMIPAAPWVVRIIFPHSFEGAGLITQLYALSLLPTVFSWFAVNCLVAFGHPDRLWIPYLGSVIVKLAVLSAIVKPFGVTSAPIIAFAAESLVAVAFVVELFLRSGIQFSRRVLVGAPVIAVVGVACLVGSALLQKAPGVWFLAAGVVLAAGGVATWAGTGGHWPMDRRRTL
jgi:O-antigen/teichoic acid export membrane protein